LLLVIQKVTANIIKNRSRLCKNEVTLSLFFAFFEKITDIGNKIRNIRSRFCLALLINSELLFTFAAQNKNEL